MTIFCLKVSRDFPSHEIYERDAGREAAYRGVLTPAAMAETEGAGWVVRDTVGNIYRGETPEAALAAFDSDRPRINIIDMRSSCGGADAR